MPCQHSVSRRSSTPLRACHATSFNPSLSHRHHRNLPPAYLLRPNKILLLLLQPLRKTKRHLQRPRHNIRRRQRQPLTQTDVRHPITLVYLNPRQIVRLRRVLNVVAAVIGKHARVAGLEVKGARVAVADEDGGSARAGVEVQPFLGVGVPVELRVGWGTC